MKSIVVFGGSSAAGESLTGKLASQGHGVINVDHNKSNVEGVVRYPYDAGTSQTRGILSVVNPDLIVNCDTFDEGDEVSVLNYISKLCAILSHCAEHNVPKIVVASHSDVINNTVDNLNAICNDTQVIVTEFDKLEDTVQSEVAE